MFVHILLLIQGRRKYRANKSAREKYACTCARGVRGFEGVALGGMVEEGGRGEEREQKEEGKAGGESSGCWVRW